MNRLFVLAIAAIFALSVAQKPRCGQTCKFRFCRADGFDTVFDTTGPRLLLRDPNVATNPFVCNRVGTGRIKVIKTGKSMVYSASQLGTTPEPFVLVSKFSSNPKFPKNYFGLKSINKFPPIPGEKGIFRSKSGGKFEAASDDLCVKIPITRYRVVSSGRTIKTKAADDCVSFRSIVPEILIEATWDSSDDLDINVQEPAGGEKISFRNTDSATGGRLILDQNVDRCAEDPDGREQIRWLLDDSPKSGTYTVQIRHWQNCNLGPTKWNVAVIVRGKLVTLESGTSNLDDDAFIREFTFKYP